MGNRRNDSLSSSILHDALAQLKTELTTAFMTEINNLRSAIVDQTAELRTLKEIIVSQEKKIDALNKQPTLKESAWKETSVIQNSLREIIDEEKEREDKKDNLILFNLPECSSNVESDIDSDNLKEVQELFKIMNINTDMLPKSMKRIGKKPNFSGKPRALIITLKDEKYKGKIFTECKKIRELPDNHTYHNVHIKNDLTKLQQEEEKLLFAELKRRREAGEIVKIKRGKIVLN